MKTFLIVTALFIAVATAFAANIYSRGSTMTNKDGAIAFVPCPAWDWDAIAAECAKDGMVPNDYMIAFNCVPKCGKWAGDLPDIGAFEYVPGQTAEKPWGDYNGVPMDAVVVKEFLKSPGGFKAK